MMNRLDPVDWRFARPLDARALADEPSFQLGPLAVDPARLQAVHTGTTHPMEPRAMQVLVVLAAAEGRVVSRDELVDRCWDGRIVGDNAIQRIISRLRALGRDTAAFEIEAVTKVGYLLRPSQAAPEPSIANTAPPRSLPPPEPPARGDPAFPGKLSRRALIGAGLAAAGLGAAGLAVWRGAAAPTPEQAMAAKLVGKARESMLLGPFGAEQAIAYLEEATAGDPQSAEAWGQLALARVSRLETAPLPELPLIASQARDAAGSALALEPGQPDARIARATIPANFRNWATNERALLALEAEIGSHPALEAAIGWLLCDVGRWRDAVARFRKALAFEPFQPHNRWVLALGLWGQGGFAEADRILADAARLWPQNRAIWIYRFDLHAGTGRPAEALAMVRDVARRPPLAEGDSDIPYDAMDAFATALVTREPADMARANAVIGMPENPGPIGWYPFYFVAMGRVDDCLTMLERRYFGAPGRPAPVPLQRVKTAFLFKYPPLRRSPRFPGIVQRLGLDAYWRETGTRPDNLV